VNKINRTADERTTLPENPISRPRWGGGQITIVLVGKRGFGTVGSLEEMSSEHDAAHLPEGHS